MPILLLAVSVPVAAQPANPQPAEQQQASPQQLRAFVASFQAGVSNGCLLTPPKTLKFPVLIAIATPNHLSIVTLLTIWQP